MHVDAYICDAIGVVSLVAHVGAAPVTQVTTLATPTWALIPEARPAGSWSAAQRATVTLEPVAAEPR